MEETKQHVQLPTNMINITPKDQLIYLSIRRFMNSQSKIAFPSLAKISQVSGAAINTVRESIKVLEEGDYFKVVKKGRSQEYHFNELKAFEPFSYDFLDNPDLTFTEKSYIVASQQYMFTDVQDLGKISFSNKELATKINMSEATISRTNKSLKNKNLLDIIPEDSSETKIFKLAKLGQAIIWTLKDHEERISQNTDDIQLLKEKLEKLEKEREADKKLIDSLLKDREVQPLKYII